MSDAAVVLELQDVAKVYPNGTRALAGVSFAVRKGSVHGLVGGNGAGKSTLIKVLAGVHEADSGRILWHGEEVRWRSPREASSAGLATIHQTVPLVPSLSVLENVVLSESGWRRIPSRARANFDTLLDRMDYSIDPAQLVNTLSIGQRQMVAILQALAIGAEVVVMDEPTASLASHERETVFASIRRLAATGTSFIYVSHFLDEVLSLTDELTLIRDGGVVDSGPTADFTEERLADGIAGHRLAATEAKQVSQVSTEARVVLRVAELSSPEGIENIDLQVRAGEIVGVAGLLGSGRSELLHAIFGSDRLATGTVEVAGKPVARSIKAAMNAGLALVPEERIAQGLFSTMPIWRNITLPSLPSLSAGRIFPRNWQEHQKAIDSVRTFDIKTDSVEHTVGELSGGNAQKVLFAKWLLRNATVYLLDEPFHGIDVGAKAEIVEIIQGLARAGAGVVVVDSEFRELLAMCNRVVVMRRGRLAEELDPMTTSDHELLLAASGMKSREAHVSE